MTSGWRAVARERGTHARHRRHLTRLRELGSRRRSRDTSCAPSGPVPPCCCARLSADARVLSTRLRPEAGSPSHEVVPTCAATAPARPGRGMAEPHDLLQARHGRGLLAVMRASGISGHGGGHDGGRVAIRWRWIRPRRFAALIPVDILPKAEVWASARRPSRAISGTTTGRYWAQRPCPRR